MAISNAIASAQRAPSWQYSAAVLRLRRDAAAGADHFLPIKHRRNIFKESIAVGYRYGLGGLHQPIAIVVGQSQAHLIERGHGKAPRSA
jgi:hypothetical protein